MDTPPPYPVHTYWPADEPPKWVLVFWFQKLDGRTELVGFEMKSVRTHFGDDDKAGRAERAMFELPGVEGFDYPEIEPRPLRAETLKKVRLDDERYRALRDERETIGPVLDRLAELHDANVEPRAAWREAVGADEDTGRTVGRPRTYGPEHFQLVADLYRRAYELGIRRTNVWIAEQMTEVLGEPVTRKQVERWVYRARHEFHTLGEEDQ